jgi:hypothetical protein
MHPDLVRQIAADHIADLTREAVQSRLARLDHPARRLPRNPLRRIAG